MKKNIDTTCYQYLFGQNLARLRKINGLTHSDMENYGISRAYYGKIELGLNSVTIDKLILISKAFGVPVYQLFLDEKGRPIKINWNAN